MQSGGGEAERLVRAVYGALDLFSGDHADLSEWSRRLSGDTSVAEQLPDFFSPDSKAVLVRHLTEAGVVDREGSIDQYTLRAFQRLVELLPHVRAAEIARQPSPRARVVLTVPREVTLPLEAGHLRASLAGRISDALISAEERVLLAAPYWSTRGNALLLPSLDRAVALGLPVTLLGARREDVSHHSSMVELGRTLAERDVPVDVFSYAPPRKNSLFHAKIVAGTTGYLGSANLTASGLEEHVEVGVPLAEVDVERVWWLVGVLVKAGVLVPEDLAAATRRRRGWRAVERALAPARRQSAAR